MGLILLVAAVVPLAAGPAVAVGTFTDDDGSPHETNIEFIAARGITGGCSTQNPNLYCPGNPVTRAQMASFIVRALNLPATGTDFFTDDNGSPHEDNINRLAAAGVTTGCTTQNPQLYCPGDGVTRAQMATFIKRAWAVPLAALDYFTDDNNSSHQPNINAIREVNITGGCSVQHPNLFCPSQIVTRGQMASFLTRAIQWAEAGATTTSTTQPVSDIYELRVSPFDTRVSSAALNGQVLSEDQYIFVPQSDPVINRVRFWIDDPTRAGAPYRVESLDLFDLEATKPNGDAFPYDTFKLSNGTHRIDVEIRRNGDTPADFVYRSATFTVQNSPGLWLTKYNVSFELAEGESAGPLTNVVVRTNNGTSTAWQASASGDTSWLTISTSGTTNHPISISASAVGASPGMHQALVTITAPGYKTAQLTVTMNVSGGG
jgi:hypothetical protein